MADRAARHFAAAAAYVPMIQMVFMNQNTPTFRVPIPIMRG